MKPTPDPDDDTEKLEAALRAEITALRDGLDAITYGFILFNADDRVVAFNASRSDLFPSFADILDVGVNYRDLLRSQLEQGQIDSATGREEEWIEDRTKNHQIADGTPTEQVFADGRVIRLREHRTSSGGIVSVRTDITDLKNAQRRLEDSEQTFRTLLETAPIPLVLAAEGKYLYANQKTHNLLGVEMGELVGRKTWDFYADPHVY
ncbi:MAG: PAS-domain containing protein, partial [Alphaproteobacteria bacterium]|nr:PAS-domain containing protein [Alphaproteobacteria bacterium]